MVNPKGNKHRKNYMIEVARLHGILKDIVSDKDPKFTSNFLRDLFKGFGENLNFSASYHPWTNVKTKRFNQVFEDM